jgi:hypothetical protein
VSLTLLQNTINWLLERWGFCCLFVCFFFVWLSSLPAVVFRSGDATRAGVAFAHYHVVLTGGFASLTRDGGEGRPAERVAHERLAFPEAFNPRPASALSRAESLGTTLRGPAFVYDVFLF